mmetsp:Transcript_55948/g.63861  ORF Transcript_55948/g.63861 Transcript_55948/m.63861 type:complete len:138 (+) Transcript_55948:1-414(+)
MIKQNKALMSLSAGHNELSDKEVNIILGALHSNKSLQILDLSWNYTDSLGSATIYQVMKYSSSLRSINFHSNPVPYDWKLKLEAFAFTKHIHFQSGRDMSGTGSEYTGTSTGMEYTGTSLDFCNFRATPSSSSSRSG